MKFKIFIFPLLMLIVSMISIGFCNEETCVDVKFDILTGSGTQDYYSGDHFWYNITVTNSGTITINATFTVTVRNTTGGVFGEVESYHRYLEPSNTTILYPNYTRLGKDEVYIYFMDTVGTYTITLTCDIPLSFYRYYATGRYTVEHYGCHMNIDVMPSYQKLQNDYMNIVQSYIDQSRVETEKTKTIAALSTCIAGIAIIFNVMSLPKTRRKEWRNFILYFLIIVLLIIVLLAYLLLP